MTKRRQAVSPMADIIAKKIFNDHEITIDFINTFLGFRPKSVQILNGTIADVKKERTSHFSTTVDILARMDDGTQVIIEIQVAYQNSFIKRLWTYSCQHLVKDLPNVRDKVTQTHDMYDKISPIYSIALVASKYFDDDQPIHSFVLTEKDGGQVLELPFGEHEELRKPFEMVIIELKKFRKGQLEKNQRQWIEFFANRAFSQSTSDVIEKAEHLLDRNTWTEEEIEMVDQWLRNASNHFGELESSYIRGIRRGKEEGRAEGLEEGLEKGLEKGRIEVAYQMLREGFSYELIEKLTGLSSDQINQLSQNHQV
ncbi:Rpn family recombination-promoting nuclease/putative transposase [Streptococcus iners]|uniref:Rpn family recombination-promoting nuclease/putative transposase n=3 Tax=Streptococcus TaxID=1301 RepID=A0AA97A5F3_9STRE|nr:Rpn family recombination-promoting nuclease/putative transposase [Streptococcus sp. 29887]MCK4026030.1 Rpn family recombination-promoting nuclease/putative transposase [Streptococcus suis]WNY51755.1 Rpn family recombination-promoting nuclease/putative transposase [Streptococcus sp. 29887]